MYRLFGSSITAMRQVFKNYDKAKEARFIKKLSPAAKLLYTARKADKWIDIYTFDEICEKASKTLYGNDRNGLYKLHLLLAEISFSSMPKIILSIIPIESLFKIAGKLWRTIHDGGEAEIVWINKHSADVIIYNYPKAPIGILAALKAQMSVLVASTGKKNIKIVFDDRDVNAWRYHLTWQ
jgi:hypothetical protein